MKRIFAALVAVMCMTGMTLVATAGTSSAQDSCATTYVGCPPLTVQADGSLTINTGLAEGATFSYVTVDAQGNATTNTATVGANGVVTLNLGGAAALSYVDANGNTVSNSIVVAAAPAAPAPAAPAPVLTSTGPLVTTTTASIAIPKQVSTTATAPKLAVTGGDVATPLLLGGALIAVGGMAIVASKRREVEFTS